MRERATQRRIDRLRAMLPLSRIESAPRVKRILGVAIYRRGVDAVPTFLSVASAIYSTTARRWCKLTLRALFAPPLSRV
jgi:hypothetical protein